MPDNLKRSDGSNTETTDELRSILAEYGPEISTLFGQVLSIYAGQTAPTTDEGQKKALLKQILEASLPQ